VIKVENVHKWFGKNHVLQGINMEIYDRETLSIIGGSGCGKTVLLKHIIGLLHPDKGKIYVDGADLGSLSEEELNEQQKKFGYLFQEGALFDYLTSGENVAFGLRYMGLDQKYIRDKVADCLTRVGLAGVEKIKPADLSGGMRKRVALARSIAYGPKYILYDEPTTGLDPIVTDTICDLILHLQRTLDITSVVVTHDMPVAYKVSNRVAMLYEGNVVALGTPDEIKNSDNPYVKQFITGSSQGPIKPKIREY
jgi:phospholipid/cholesterol/gamma-HCH transport system ATP-binding protein